MDLEDIGMKSELPKPGKLLEIGIYRKIQSSLVDRALFQASCGIAYSFADVGSGKFDAPSLERVRKQTERRFLQGAFTRIGISRL